MLLNGAALWLGVRPEFREHSRVLVLVLVTVIVHLPLAAIEGTVLGFTVSFLARVKPEMIGWKADFRRDNQVEVAFELVSAAGARALGIGDYGIAVGGAANLFTIAASCVAEAVAAHPSRKLVLFDGKIVARDGAFLAAPIRIASDAVV